MIFNLGSINLDMVYGLVDLPKAGETVSADRFEKFLGGKGVNQSVAARAAGAKARHIGAVGPDGAWVLEQITGFGLGLDDIAQVDNPTGHAIVAVDAKGENQIIIMSGANTAIPEVWMEDKAGQMQPGDFALCQNETNLTEDFARTVQNQGGKLVLSAAPFDATQVATLRPYVHLLAVNEGEAAELAQAFDQDPQDMGFPMLLVTKGSEGATVYADGTAIFQPSFKVTPVDTTGAGDTFLGSFVARLDQGEDIPTALKYAAAASALQVTKPGAAAAIPSEVEVLTFLKEQS
ncbi:MAG: ribokinase [Pseudomonadota bacterium]